MKTYFNHQCKAQSTSGILIVDINRQIVSLNRQFIDMWKLPQHIVVSRDDKKAIEFFAAQMDNPKNFLKQVQQIYTHELNVHDTIQLKDCRRFERRSFPKYLQSTIVGRIWMFRELTKFDSLKELIKRQNDISLIFRTFSDN